MKILLLTIFSFTLTLTAFSQSATTDNATSPQPSFKTYPSSFFSHVHRPLNFTGYTSGNLTTTVQHSYPSLVSCSTLPERLPLFCALEKKLKDATNFWIKIRLPEHP